MRLDMSYLDLVPSTPGRRFRALGIFTVVVGIGAIAAVALSTRESGRSESSGPADASVALPGTAGNPAGETAADVPPAVGNGPFSPLVAFGAGGLSSAQQQQLIEGYLVDCMRDRGWTSYAPHNVPNENLSEMPLRAVDVMAWVDNPAAGRRAEISVVNPNQAWIDKLSNADLRRLASDLNGNRDEGATVSSNDRDCTAESERSAAAAIPSLDGAIGLKIAEGINRVRQSPEVTGALSLWTDCVIKMTGTKVENLSDILIGGSELTPLQRASIKCYAKTIRPVAQPLEALEVEGLIKAHPNFGGLSELAKP